MDHTDHELFCSKDQDNLSTKRDVFNQSRHLATWSKRVKKKKKRESQHEKGRKSTRRKQEMNKKKVRNSTRKVKTPLSDRLYGDANLLQYQQVSTQRKSDTRHQHHKNSTYPTTLRAFETWTTGDDDDVKLIAHSKGGVLVLRRLCVGLNLLGSQAENYGALESISDPPVGNRFKGPDLVGSLAGMGIPGASEFALAVVFGREGPGGGGEEQEGNKGENVLQH
ncbi:uncharacterized protein H6S33_013133 [Morchella sextelata]|uniref:uncharacterized protein n=1 Tax=Morchella sextelata TaxID=1174677 RepID=UPI001D03F2AD|nr:uncharacterized protein H6S33_013133 [Morchella sextelata]KAH0609647.1 hypothetical protein H6S33_013133 [Morchella sextelata]